MSEKSLLIVDDDSTFAETLARAVSKRGYKPMVAHNISTAIKLAKENMPEQAVIDLKIDQESGLELIPELKSINADMDMLMLTGYSSIATAVAAIKLGARDYVCKPADADEILSSLSGSLNKSEETPLTEQPPSVKRLQWEYLQKVLKENEGNVSATARSLGMHRRTLQRMLQKRPVQR